MKRGQTKGRNASLTAIPQRFLHAAWDFIRTPSNGHWIWLRLFPSKGQFQPFNTTRANRYPRIFRFIQSELGRECAGRILSFGCSSGEEAFSLRQYFPWATIKGIDINPRNIAVARRHLRAQPDPGITFDVASSARAEQFEAYDAIFCMATLRHGDLKAPGITRCDHLIRFEDFARTVADFERCLRPGGLLIIVHSNFRLTDAPAAARFEPILRDIREAVISETPVFGPGNRRIEEVSYLDIAFRKRLDLYSPASTDAVASPSVLR